MIADFEQIPVDLAQEGDFSVGPLRVRPSSRQVESPTGSETLEPRVMQVLVTLFHRRGEVVARDELTKRCWGGRTVGEDAISRAIVRVRKLGEAQGAFTIEAIAKVGYRLIAEAGDNLSATPVGSASAPQATEVLGRSLVTQQLVLVALAFAALAVGLGVWLMTSSAPAAASKIAVLPFEILSDNPEAVALARTAPVAIANKLVESGAAVIPMSMTERAPGVGVRDASKLGATHVVEGYASIKDGQIALTTRISGADGVVLWACPLEMRSAGDDLETQAAAAVTYAFRWLNGAPAAGAMGSANMTAYMRSAACSPVQSALTAYEESQAAAEAAPQSPFMQIQQIIAGASVLSEVGIEERPRILGEIRAAYNRAMTVQPDLSTLRLAEMAMMPEVEWAGRDAVMRKGVDAEPRTGLISGNYSNFLALAGRLAEAETFARKHVAMEPTSPVASNYLAIAMLVQGRYDDAKSETARAIKLFPDNTFVLRARFSTLLITEDLAGIEAMAAEPRVYDIVDPPAPTRPIKAYLAARKSGDATSLAVFETACGDPNRLSANGAMICVIGLTQTGRIDRTFDLLEVLIPDLRSANATDIEAKWLAHPNTIQNYGKLLMTPVAAELRADPRFIDVVERIGLLDYWKASGVWPDFCQTEPKSVCAKLRQH